MSDGVDIDVEINTDDAINDVRRLQSAVDRLDDQIRTADDTTKKFERRVGGSFRQALQDVRILLGAIGIGVFLRELVQVNAAFEQVRTTLVAASDSMAIVASDFAFIRGEAVRLGMPVSQVGGEFARLAAATKGTTLEGGPAREIFSSLAEAFVATGQSADEFRLAVLAVNQMVSKGRVQAEELRGQLGERLPGAYQAAARAMGMTTAELSKALELGQVTADKLLPKLAVELRNTFGKAFEAARESPKFIMGQFQVAIENLLYTLGQSGFMVEFLGMLKDITNYLSSEEGVRGAERLGSALGFLMGQVRAAAKIIVENFDSIVAVIGGLASGGAILALKSMATWIGNIAKASGFLKLLTGPWGLLAAVIGIAVGAVMKYGDSLVTVGNNTARLGDWFRAAFEVPSQMIRDDLIPAVRDFIVQIPVIGDVFVAATTGLSVFKDTFASTKNLSEAVGASFMAMGASLRNGLGEETFSKLVGAFQQFKNIVDALQPVAQALFNGMINGAQVAWIFIQEFFAEAGRLFGDLFTSAKNIATDLWGVFSNLWKIISGLFGQMDGKVIFGGLIGGISLVADVVYGLALSIVDTIEFAVDFVARLLDMIMPILEPVAQAIGAVFAKIIEYIGKLAGVKLDTSQYDNLLAVLSLVGNVLTSTVGLAAGLIQGVSNVVGQVISAVADVVGGVWTAVESVLVGVFDMFKWLSQGAIESSQISADATAAATESSGVNWIKVGDVAVGVFLSIIEIVGQVIMQLSNLVQAIVEVARRFGSFFEAVGDGFTALVTRDAAKAQSARDKFADIFGKPIEVGFADDFEAFTAGFADNFNVVSNATNFGKGMKTSFDQFGTDLKDNFGRISSLTGRVAERSFGPNSEISAVMGDSGTAAAGAYIDGFVNAIGSRASELTTASTEAQRRLEAGQKAAAQDAARAFAEREAGLDRTTETPADKSKGGSGRGGKTAGQRAQDRIRELAVEIAMNNQLTKSLQDQNLTQDQLRATVKATETLRRAGYDMTYDQAIANGGMAKQLAAIAYEAEMSEVALNKARKAAEAIGEINIENANLQAQIKAAEDLSVSRKEYGFQLEAVKELQRAGIDMTYEEAIAAGGLAAQLAKVAYERAQNKYILSGAEGVAAAIEGYKSQAQSLQMYADAAASGATSTHLLDAALTAQNAVMQANGDTLWESYDALDANEKALYDMAYAQAVAGASGKTFVGLAMEIRESYNDILDPLANNRASIMSWSETTRASLTAMYNNVTTMTPQIEAAYRELMSKINTVTQVEMMRNSNKLTDRFAVSLLDMKNDVTDWAGNIQDIWSSAVDSMTNSLTDFVMTGKLNFADLALSIIKDIAKMMVKWLAWMALKTAASFFGIPLPFEDGGIMTSSGSMPLKTYSKGGIANSPQLAMFGEGRQPEAYVPLPDGRTIPVTLTGMDQAVGQQITYNNTYEIDAASLANLSASVDKVFTPRVDSMSEADSRRSEQVYATQSNVTSGDINIVTEVTYQGGGNGGNGQPSEYDQRMMTQMSRDLSSMIKTQVIEVVQNELRPGGQFNKSGRGRSL